MKIYAMLWVCPECRKTVTFVPDDHGVFQTGAMVCSEDGYPMRNFKVNSLMVDNLLKHGVPDAPSETAGA